ncbi:MAG: hypothetical protein AMJ94_19350 [Deltaproteobacteria bacterium SM23_61]|nr:MAG: hypothetical protein AMJ94_19350 [Deltaproteobacteria bacterium SM23_61]
MISLGCRFGFSVRGKNPVKIEGKMLYFSSIRTFRSQRQAFEGVEVRKKELIPKASHEEQTL